MPMHYGHGGKKKPAAKKPAAKKAVAKKKPTLSSKQKKIAALGGDTKRIDSKDMGILRRRGMA